ncbi:MAG: NADH-quinone oxidoreductase subunit J family protein [Planctomycetota bacterium]|jgi:NADH-quinone oxidoreductase subunit J
MIPAGVVMIISIAGAVIAVAARNIVHAVLGLAIALGGIALAFLLLNSPFLAAMEVLIYIGGITIAMIFAVMLSPTGKHEPGTSIGRRIAAGLVSVVFFVAVAALITSTDLAPATETSPAGPSDDWSVQAIGRHLLDDYNVAFELLSVVLLVAIVGAISIAARRDEDQDPAIDDEVEA